MGNPADEAALLRRRLDALEADVAAMARRGDCGATARVIKVGVTPGESREFISAKEVEIDGDEEEGGTPTLAEIGETFVAALVGTKKPPAATYLVARLVGGFWTAQYDGEE